MHRFAGRLEEVLEDLLGTDGHQGLALSVLGPHDTAEAIAELTRARARLDGLLASLLAHADTVEVGAHMTPVATSTGAWLAHATTTPQPAAHRQVKHAKRLAGERAATGAALRAGACDLAQAHVVVRAVDALPPEVGPDLRNRAEAHLLDLARAHDAKELARLARHLHEVIDPDGAEAALAERLAREEEAAEATATLTLRDDGKGRTTGRFEIPTVHGALLTFLLDAFASPTRPVNRPATGDQPGEPGEPGLANGWVDDPTQPGRKITRDQLRGRAFLELLETLPVRRLPASGGGPFTVVVTMALDTLLGGLGTGVLDTGHAISPGEARRLAARHGVIPAVLGSRSEVLDLGRRTRLHTTAMRTALRVHHRTCSAEGCTIPAAWCHAHHMIPWARGGGTSVTDGTLLCARHHRLVHHPAYAATYDPGGTTHLTRIRR